MICLLFSFAYRDTAVGHCSLVCKRLVKFNYKIVLEVIRHTTAVFGRITDNTVICRINLHIRTLVKRINHYVRMLIFRESKTEQSSPFSRNQLCHYIMFCQIYLIIICLCFFTFMRKPAGTFVFIKHRLSYHRHNGKLTVVINPRAGLMGLLKPSDFSRSIHILPSISHLPSLRCPEVHTPRTCNSRIRISGRKLISRLSTNQRIYIVCIIGGLTVKGKAHYHN